MIDEFVIQERYPNDTYGDSGLAGTHVRISDDNEDAYRSALSVATSTLASIQKLYGDRAFRLIRRTTTTIETPIMNPQAEDRNKLNESIR